MLFVSIRRYVRRNKIEFNRQRRHIASNKSSKASERRFLFNLLFHKRGWWFVEFFKSSLAHKIF